MKKVITVPQACDMGDGRGIIEFNEGTTVGEILEFYKRNSRSWGLCTIIHKGEILRKFDFDIYNNNIFYTHLTWEKDFKVKEAEYSYCFMNEDLTIIC